MLLVQFALFNTLVQYHNSVHPSEHGFHQEICPAPQGDSAVFRTDDLEQSSQSAARHAACAICYLCATSQPVPAGDIPPLSAGLLRLIPVPPADSPYCTAAEIRCGRAPPLSA